MRLSLLAERAPWPADFEAELFAFPGSRHDDQCDSVSQALTEEHEQRMPPSVGLESTRRCNVKALSDFALSAAALQT
jgi:hypothetical protein